MEILVLCLYLLFTKSKAMTFLFRLGSFRNKPKNEQEFDTFAPFLKTTLKAGTWRGPLSSLIPVSWSAGLKPCCVGQKRKNIRCFHEEIKKQA